MCIRDRTCDNAPEVLQIALATLERYAQIAGVSAPAVRQARHGLLATAVGGAALVLHQYLRPIQPQPAASRARVER